MEYNRLQIKAHPRESDCLLTRDNCDVQLTTIRCAVLSDSQYCGLPVEQAPGLLDQ